MLLGWGKSYIKYISWLKSAKPEMVNLSLGVGIQVPHTVCETLHASNFQGFSGNGILSVYIPL